MRFSPVHVVEIHKQIIKETVIMKHFDRLICRFCFPATAKTSFGDHQPTRRSARDHYRKNSTWKMKPGAAEDID